MSGVLNLLISRSDQNTGTACAAGVRYKKKVQNASTANGKIGTTEMCVWMVPGDRIAPRVHYAFSLPLAA
jgi:hypothetical protein